MHCAYLGRRFTLPAIPLRLGAGVALERAVTFTSDQADRRRELQQHLQDNRDHYSAAIFRSLDSATLTFLLSGFQLDGRPLIDQVEPRPVTVAGNYVVLRAPVEDDERSGLLGTGGDPVTWGKLLEGRGLDRASALDRRLIPIPTGGVFAEAVLGRSNAAEKLDITRFWNWQLATDNLIKDDPAATYMSSNFEMRSLLANAQTMSLMHGHARTNAYTITDSKIGLGTLGRTGNCRSTPSRGCVHAEAMIIERTALPNATFVVVYQNVLDPRNRKFKDLERIRRRGRGRGPRRRRRRDSGQAWRPRSPTCGSSVVGAIGCSRWPRSRST